MVHPYESQRGKDLNQIAELEETGNHNDTPVHEIQDFNPLADEEIEVGGNSMMPGERYKAAAQTSKTAQGDYQKVKILKRKGDGKRLTSTFHRDPGAT